MTSAAADQAAAPTRAWLDRVYAALPVVTAFVWFAALYAWEAWNHKSPWLFTDELELTQLSRAIADTGHAARRGEPHFFDSLYTFLIAPAWWIHSTSRAYGVVKYIGIFTMTAALFPAYLLARTVVSPRAALFAAAATVAVPALAYGDMIVEEVLAYPYAALCFLLIVKSIATRSRRWIAAAVVASIVAPLVRGELAVIPVVFVLAVCFALLTSPAGMRWRKGWNAWDWIGAFVLTTGVLVLFSGVAGYYSHSWSIATGHYRGRMIEYGLWAAGAFTIGVGIFPVLIALAGLVRPKGEEKTRELQALLALLAAAMIGFGLYTAVKASYQSTVFATRIQERNLIYLVPLVFVATAVWLERPRLRLVPLACAVGFVAYLIVTTPFALQNVPYSDAFGLAIAQMANRNLAFSDGGVQLTLLSVLAISVLVLLAPRLLARRTRVVRGLLAATAGLVLAWSLAGQISAARYSNDSASAYIRNFPHPTTWLDEITKGEPALYLGQNIDSGSALGIWLTEFWNRSLEHVWTLDGTAPGPGGGFRPPSLGRLTPDLATVNGRLFPDPHVRWVMVERGIDVVGRAVAKPPRSGRWTVYHVTGPLRLAHAQTGITTDGWIGCDNLPCGPAAYNQYATPDSRPGYVVVTVSRFGACGAPIKPGRVRIVIGRLIKGSDKQPHLGRITAVRTWVVDAGVKRTFSIRSPKPPFRIEVRVSPTFVPRAYGESDRRHLGAQVAFRFSPTPVRETQRRCT